MLSCIHSIVKKHHIIKKPRKTYNSAKNNLLLKPGTIQKDIKNTQMIAILYLNPSDFLFKMEKISAGIKYINKRKDVNTDCFIFSGSLNIRKV